MLFTIQIVRTPATERLLKLWAKRYTPELSSLPLDQEPWLYVLLVEASSPEGRADTAAKLQDSLVNINCQMAGIQARSLYEYIPMDEIISRVKLEQKHLLLPYTQGIQQAFLKERMRLGATLIRNCELFA